MADELISVRDIAIQLGKRKQTVFEILKRLGIEATKRRSTTGRNQLMAYVTLLDFRRVCVEFEGMSIATKTGEVEKTDDFISSEAGIFYLIQLEPEFDPTRFKLGFAAGMAERLRYLRYSAPFAVVLRTWPCRRLWERTVIDSVSFGCDRLHTEVFRTRSLDDVIVQCDRFFAMMPPIEVQNQAVLP